MAPFVGDIPVGVRGKNSALAFGFGDEGTAKGICTGKFAGQRSGKDLPNMVVHPLAEIQIPNVGTGVELFRGRVVLSVIKGFQIGDFLLGEKWYNDIALPGESSVSFI